MRGRMQRIVERLLMSTKVYSVDGLCTADGISRAHLYREWRRGSGPAYMQRGSRRFVTEEARLAYHAQLVEQTSTQRAQGVTTEHAETFSAGANA
jgi:hypothetical protein